MTEMTLKEINQQSVLAADKFLREIIQTPADFVADESLRDVLKSQGAFAKYEDTSKCIVPCAKNTQESNADLVLEDGYAGLDQRRINALKALNKAIGKKERPNPETKAGLKLQVKELKQEIEMLKIHNVMMTGLLTDIKDTASNYAERSGSQQLQADWVEQRKKISAKVSFINNKHLLKEMSNNVILINNKEL
ncbi:hypothetical protein [Photobacterium chitinilyticum]|uniref:Uncharacterized protein n=1 Tax=Photobacterium chitinilyticum TaxID=2485123 RepID=A0A444JQK9_9GAMM|nr:hypothetical protein [Photobacterium chitinilyticum]RWX55349.1 hypothetical protein EDI28_12350 [Photobacterium chitinilyticum]